MVPAGNQKVLNTWFKLGFSHEQVHGIVDVTTKSNEYHKANLTVHLAKRDEEGTIRSLATLISEHQVKAPVFAPYFPEDISK
jgi:hypothetical protein